VGLQISARKSGNVTILDLRGRIAFGSDADSLKSELHRLSESSPAGVIVNLSEATLIDSSGIGALVQAYVGLTRSGGTLVLLNPTGSVREALEVTHVHNTIPTYTDEAAALLSLRNSSAHA
jgi:anti-sigma B factor antagonist